MTSRLILIAVAVLTILGLSPDGFAQRPTTASLTPWEPSAIGGLQPVIPRTPDELPRPLQGDGPGEQWNLRDAEEAQAPVASLIEGAKGNDVSLAVVVGQGRLLTTKRPIAREGGIAVIAVGDPTIIDFEVLPNPRAIRIIGQRAGVTDLSIATDDGEFYNFEVHVVYDLRLLEYQLQQVFPDALINLAQIREHVVVKGQARSPGQVRQIIQTIQAFLASVQIPHSLEGEQNGTPEPFPQATRLPEPDLADGTGDEPNAEAEGIASGEADARPSSEGTFPAPQVINLLQVPGAHQVQLQVRIAEVDRTALRSVGADILGIDPDTGNIIGTSLGNGVTQALGVAGSADILEIMTNAVGLAGVATGANGTSTTAFGIFPSGDFQVLLQLLRKNSVLSILAEPNLVAMSGHTASFLAGGQFPIPVPQVSGGVANSVTVQFKDFGVSLDFTPYVLDDDMIRLRVEPEVSTIDESLGTTLVVGGDPVPGVNTRRAQTTVELREGQTLAIAGLLSVELDAETNRIPGLGDLPYIGPLFSNTSHNRKEKELLVMVTPHIVAAVDEEMVGPLPGADIQDPTDKEFYLYNRIEGRQDCNFRSTTSWDTIQHPATRMRFEKRYAHGRLGFSP